MNIFEELSWPQFKELGHIKPLPLNEQMNFYNSYLNELSRNRYLYENWLANQNKGPRRTQETLEVFLLQENGDYLLQEDGSKIIIE